MESPRQHRKATFRQFARRGLLLLVISGGAVIAVGCDRFKTHYALDQLPLTYSGMAGLQVSFVPGMGRRPDCPEDGNAGCIVGYRPLGDDPSMLPEQVLVTISCFSQDGRMVYKTVADPRNFVAPKLPPGFYNITMQGENLDKNYGFTSVQVQPRQATLMGISVRKK